jgi:hypothetical protein
VTTQQQSREFVFPTNLEAVNFGKNVEPDLVDWGREGSGAALISSPESGPRFLTDELLRTCGPDLSGLGG